MNTDKDKKTQKQDSSVKTDINKTKEGAPSKNASDKPKDDKNKNKKGCC
jgi:hypothetical protein